MNTDLERQAEQNPNKKEANNNVSSLPQLSYDVVAGFLDDKYYLSFVNYDESLDDNLDVISQCIKRKDSSYLNDFVLDAYMDQEREAVKEAIDNLMRRLSIAGYDDDDIDVFFEDESNLESLKEDIYSRDCSTLIEDLLRNTSDLQVVLYFKTPAAYNKEVFIRDKDYYDAEYLEAVGKLLNLDPDELSKACDLSGPLNYDFDPTKPSLVSIDDFVNEFNNNIGNMSSLAVLAQISPRDLYQAEFNIETITIPKGNTMGLVDNGFGAGSLLGMTLQQDMEVDLKSGNWELSLDYYGYSIGYSVDEIYGLFPDSYGGLVKINEERAKPALAEEKGNKNSNKMKL